MKGTDVLGVLFCVIGLLAAVGAFRVFLDRARPPVPIAATKNEGPRGLRGFLLAVVFFLLGFHVGRRPDGPIGWLSAFVTLALIAGIFL